MIEPVHVAIVETGFEDLYRREYPGLVAVATALSGHDGEDLVHDVMVRALTNWGRVRDLERPGGWCHRVLVNVCRSRWRRRMTEARFWSRRSREEPSSPGPSADVLAFWAAVRELPQRPRLAVTLYYAGDRTTAEVATILDVPEGTVRSDLSRARIALARELGFEMSEDRVDEIARHAGTALRRPAPADGLANVRSSHRRRRAARVAAGGTAVALAAVGAFMVVGRGDDDGTVVTESTTVTTSTTPSTTTTTAPPTTTTLPTAVESAWQPSAGAFPQLAFAACCGLNWEEGQPSPDVPADPDEPLSPGIYNARSVLDDQSVDDFADGVLALELRPYTRCTELVEFGCFDPPFADNELGVPNTAARAIEVVLDDSVRVGLHGYRCVDNQLELETWLATGADLATLTSELGAAYETAVAAPLRAGVSPEQVAADLAANRTAGFFDPGCPGSTDFAWTSPGGPTVITPLYLSSQNPSIAAPRILPPEGLAVDEQGVMTIYVFAGFRS